MEVQGKDREVAVAKRGEVSVVAPDRRLNEEELRQVNRVVRKKSGDDVMRLTMGEVNLDALSVADRQGYVERMTSEGMTVEEMARLLGVDERTVVRDRRELRRWLKLDSGARLGDEMLGELERVTMDATQRLLRMCEDPGAPFYARLWGQTEVVRMHERLLRACTSLRVAARGEEKDDRLEWDAPLREEDKGKPGKWIRKTAWVVDR